MGIGGSGTWLKKRWLLLPVYILAIGAIVGGNAINSRVSRMQEPEWSLLLPEDEGRVEVELSCSNCHGLKQLITQRKSEAGWRASVQKMVSSYQAPIDKEDFPILVAYLSKHFGEGNVIEELPININACSAAVLQRLPGISKETAEEIIRFRGSNGRFTDVEDLIHVRGINKDTFKSIKAFISIGESTK